MAAPRGEQDQDGDVMLFAIVLVLTIGCIAFILAREGHGGPAPGMACGGASGPAAGVCCCCPSRWRPP